MDSINLNNYPVVSVLMTAYNREKYIGEAIESVLASIFQDFELIIVDDCSLDKTVDIAKSYEAKDSRIKVYINESNLGDYPNRNKAASYAKGKYIKYLDSDDTMRNDCLMVMVGEMEKHPQCAFGISSKSESNTIVHSTKSSFRIHFFKRGILDISPSGSIIRRDIFNDEKGFWELRCVSDFEFWMRLALKFPMLELPKELIFWREHEDQEIQLGNEEYLKYNFSILKDKIKISQLNELEKNTIIQKYKKNTIRYLIKNIFKLGIIKTFKYINMNQLKLNDAI